MVLMWRMGLGRLVNAYPSVFGRIMVITHTGRNSSRKYRTPVNYAWMDGGTIICVAGFGSASDWYRNMMAHPGVELWLPEGWRSGTFEEMDDIDTYARTRIMREVLINSGFAAYAAGIDPKRMSDAELAEATRSYRLVRILLTGRLTGKGGPGDLAWLWPFMIFVLLPLYVMLLRRCIRKMQADRF